MPVGVCTLYITYQSADVGIYIMIYVVNRFMHYIIPIFVIHFVHLSFEKNKNKDFSPELTSALMHYFRNIILNTNIAPGYPSSLLQNKNRIL